MTFFFFLPSILLSGFMFPFRGMPGWAQAIGEALPLTHFLRVVRGVMLKGAGCGDVTGNAAGAHGHPAGGLGARHAPLRGDARLESTTQLSSPFLWGGGAVIRDGGVMGNATGAHDPSVGVRR